MKFPLPILLVFTLSYFCGTAQHVVLFEQFTSNTSSPDATANATFDPLCLANPSKVQVIKYHMSWPGSGSTFYPYNSAEFDQRRTFYGVNAVPDVQVDGTYFSSHPSGIGQTEIDQWHNLSASASLNFTSMTISGNQLSFTVEITALNSWGSNVVMQAVLIERNPTSPTPASNGETNFYWVCRDLIPTPSGTSIPALSTGSQHSVTINTTLDPVNTNINDLQMVVMVQNMSTGAVLGNSMTDVENIVTCFPSSNLAANNITMTTADLSWIAGSGQTWAIEYGAPGFTQGSGILISGLNSNSYQLPNLTMDTDYEVYVRDNCADGSTSEWVGPLAFSTLDFVCPVPTNLQSFGNTGSAATINWTGTTGNSWIMEYGPQGFSPGLGTTQASNTTTSTITGLNQLNFYDVYVREICGSLLGDWAGPHTFNTTAVGIEDATNGSFSFTLFPNPSKDAVELSVNGISNAGQGQIQVFDFTGRLMFSQSLDNATNGVQQLDVQSLASGTYLVELTSGNETAQQRLVIAH